MSAVLAIDLGKTTCRAALWTSEGEEPALAEGPGAPGLAATAGVDAAETAISQVYRRIVQSSQRPKVGAVCVGAAGSLAAPISCRALAGRLSALFPTGAIAVCSDAVIAHAGALDGRPGLVLTLGTGAAAVGVDSGGLVQVDGWGPLLGDAGSGGWIGIAGLRAALRAADGRGPDTALEAAAADQFGELSFLPAILAADGNAARTAARFAPAVARLALEGDKISQQILHDAATELAGSAIAAASRLTSPVTELALTGGLMELGPSLMEPLQDRLSSAGLATVAALGGPLAGARLLATRTDTPHERYLHRAGQPVRPLR
jgi:glucosamine kinase